MQLLRETTASIVYNLAVRPVILLFAKAPRPGLVKTRLQPPLTPASAAALHTAFVSDTLALLANLQDICDVELHTDVPTDAWPAAGVARELQCAGDLGARLYHAMEKALRAGRPSVMVVGSDSPTLPAGHLRMLLGDPADVALGPTEDGGYYAIHCRRLHPAMFAGVVWSTCNVLRQTTTAAQTCGLTVFHGPRWFDVDEPADLSRLLSGPLPPATRAWAKEWGRHGYGHSRLN